MSAKFNEHNAALLQVAAGACLLDPPSNDEIENLATRAKLRVLSLSSNAQHVGSKSKDASLRENIGRSETSTTHLRNVRSQLLHHASNATKCDVECLQRPKKSTENDCVPGPHFYKRMLIQIGKCFSTANDKAYLIHCRHLLSAGTSYETRCIDEDT